MSEFGHGDRFRNVDVLDDRLGRPRGLGAPALEQRAQESDQVLGGGVAAGRIVGEADDVAREAFDACMNGDVICVPGAINRAAMIASGSTPRWLVRRLGGFFGRRAV